MSSPSAAILHDLLTQATTGDNRTVVENTPDLAWLLPRLDRHREKLRRLLAGKPADDTIALLRTEAAEADALSDDAHRHLRLLLEAGLYKGDSAARASIAQALTTLYPDGLGIVNLSWRKTAVAATVFAERLGRSDVQAALNHARAYAPGIDDAARNCIEAGRNLDAVLVRLDAAEGDAAARPRERELFDARNAALPVWSTFVTNVELVLAGDDTATARERILRRWRAFQEDIRRTAPAARPAQPAPVPADPEPA